MSFSVVTLLLWHGVFVFGELWVDEVLCRRLFRRLIDDEEVKGRRHTLVAKLLLEGGARVIVSYEILRREDFHGHVLGRGDQSFDRVRFFGESHTSERW